MTRYRLGRAVSLLGLLACNEPRESAPPAPTFADDVQPLFAARCTSCHGADAGLGFRPGTYVGAIGCVDGGAPAALPQGSEEAPLLRVLRDPRHVAVLTDEERARIAAWIGGGAPAFRGSVHAPGIIDPRSPDFHGKVLRAQRYAPMVDANDPGACGLCHDGTASRPRGVVTSAPRATACTSCHTEKEGVFACTTCHGSPAGLAGPKDTCFHPEERDRPNAHGAHVNPSSSHAMGLACATCHPAPLAGQALRSGAHANGALEIQFDPKVVGAGSFDPSTKACAVGCHDQGGARARLSWRDRGPLGCGDCHGAPPRRHPTGACTSCHKEANAAGTKLSGGSLHVNGRVDLGDGSGKCGACHGSGEEAWPTSGAHGAHQAPKTTSPIECASCHSVPAEAKATATHFNGRVDVTFGGRALARGAVPYWDGATCQNVACHGAGLYEKPRVVPRFDDTSGAASACDSCHGAPPAQQHTTSASCERSTCHGDIVGRAIGGAPFITTSGRAKHINGTIDVP